MSLLVSRNAGYAMTNENITKDDSMESFTKLIPIIFLIIWTIIAIKGKKKKKQVPSTDKEKKLPPATPFDKLQNTFKDLFAELEKPVEEKPLETLKPEKTRIPETKKTRIEKDIEIKLSDTDIKPSAPKPQETKPSYQTYTGTVVKTTAPVKKLREAVIWSEILGKPVSIRDE